MSTRDAGGGMRPSGSVYPAPGVSCVNRLERSGSRPGLPSEPSGCSSVVGWIWFPASRRGGGSGRGEGRLAVDEVAGWTPRGLAVAGGFPRGRRSRECWSCNADAIQGGAREQGAGSPVAITSRGHALRGSAGGAVPPCGTVPSRGCAARPAARHEGGGTLRRARPEGAPRGFPRARHQESPGLCWRAPLATGPGVGMPGELAGLLGGRGARDLEPSHEGGLLLDEDGASEAVGGGLVVGWAAARHGQSFLSPLGPPGGPGGCYMHVRRQMPYGHRFSVVRW